MAERYWITGAQIGMLQGFMSGLSKVDLEKVLKEVQENQFIGRMEEPYEDFEIIIKRKGDGE